MFAYLNPRREDLFASSFAKQVAWIERGLKTELVHGNLDSVRTLIDVATPARLTGTPSFTVSRAKLTISAGPRR